MAVDSISALQAVNNLLDYGTASGSNLTSAVNTEFRDVLAQVIQNAETTTTDSTVYNDALLLGEVDDLHSIGIASSEAELAISLVVQVRDKIVDAYSEIMRMQV